MQNILEHIMKEATKAKMHHFFKNSTNLIIIFQIIKYKYIKNEMSRQ